MLKFRVSGQRVALVEQSYLVGDSVAYLEAQFAFSSEWADLVKWVRLTKPGEQTMDVMLQGDMITSAKQIDLTSGVWTIAVFGDEVGETSPGTRITTNVLSIKVDESGLAEASPFTMNVDDASRVVAEAIRATRNAEDTAAAILAAKERGEFNGKDGETYDDTQINDSIVEMNANDNVAIVTSYLNATEVGVTATNVNGKLRLTGKATGGRRVLFVNGQNQYASTKTSFKKSLSKGRYHFSYIITGKASNDSRLVLDYTYNMFGNDNNIVPNGKIITFDEDAMIGFFVANGMDFGSGAEYTEIEIRACKINDLWDGGFETHNTTLGAMIDIADSYFKVAYEPNDSIIYQNMRGIWQRNTLSDAGQKSMTCSQLVQTCFAGVPFEDSRFVKNKNIMKPFGFMTDGDAPAYSLTEDAETISGGFNDYMSSENQAKYFVSKGLARRFSLTHARAVRPGDILFYAETDDIETVDHCAVCVSSGDHRYQVIESVADWNRVDGAPVSPRIKTWRFDERTPLYHVKSPADAYPHKTKIVYENKNTLLGTTSQTAFTTIMLGESVVDNIEKGFYTFSADIDYEADTTSDQHPYILIHVWYDRESYGTSTNREEFIIPSVDGKVKGLIYAQSKIYGFQVKIYYNDKLGHSYAMKNVKIHSGYYPY